MNDYTLSPASRRDVLLAGFTATVAVGLPPARPPSLIHRIFSPPKHTKDVRP